MGLAKGPIKSFGEKEQGVVRNLGQREGKIFGGDYLVQ